MGVEESVAKDFSFLKGRKDVLAVLVFGSHAKGEATPHSDVDVCVVAPKAEKLSLLSFILQNISSEKYHIWLFEELPLYMKKEVMDNHRIAICRDKLELYEYFYFVNKLWKDQEHRQKVTREELKRMFAGR